MSKTVKLNRPNDKSLVRESTNTYGASSSGKNGKEYDLEERTFRFARDVRTFVKTLPRTIGNIEDVKQLVRASGSVGANYIEANESLGKKDFALRIKISRKEAKESRYFLRLLDTGSLNEIDNRRNSLVQEASELMNIFGAIFRKTQKQG